MNLQENIRRVLREIEEDRIQIRLGRSAERHFGTVQNIIIQVDNEDITGQDGESGLGKMNIVIKDGEIIVGDIFIPEKYRRQGIATQVYQKISDHFGLPIVNSKTKGFNQTMEGGYMWKDRENFEPRNLQESIRRILREDVSNRAQEKLNQVLKSLGVVSASKVVGSFSNLAKKLGLEMDDLKTQEMLVKSFIYHTDIEDVNILHLEINRDRPDKVRIKIHFETNNPANNMQSWLVRTLCDEMNKFFPFKTAPYWEPAFAGRNVTVILDSEQIVNDEEID